MWARLAFWWVSLYMAYIMGCIIRAIPFWILRAGGMDWKCSYTLTARSIYWGGGGNWPRSDPDIHSYISGLHALSVMDRLTDWRRVIRVLPFSWSKLGAIMHTQAEWVLCPHVLWSVINLAIVSLSMWQHFSRTNLFEFVQHTLAGHISKGDRCCSYFLTKSGFDVYYFLWS